MQRFVALSSTYHHATGSSVGAVAPPWKSSARDGAGALPSLHVDRRIGKNNYRYNNNRNRHWSYGFPGASRGERLAVSCDYEQGCGGQPWTPCDSHVRRRDGIRRLSVSRGALGKNDGHELHHNHRRHHPQVTESIRDFSSDSWWTHDNDEEHEDDDDDVSDIRSTGGGVSPLDLWTSRLVLQLSLFWNLLGYSPSKVDEWLVSHEARRRLNGLNNKRRFSSSVSSHTPSLPALPFNPLRDVFGSPMQNRIFSHRFYQFLSGATPQIMARERVSSLLDGVRNLGFVQWLARMKETYGTSFMVLVTLGYATQGFRCFPWFAVGYMLKDGLQVDPGYMQFLLSSAALPMVLKPIYGIISDTVYIRGAHRVPYLAIAGILQLLSWGVLVMSQTATSSAVLLTAALTFGNLGAAVADVMNDALVAEVSKRKKGSGELQSFAWLIMGSGGLLGNLFGGFALKHLNLTTMYSIFFVLLAMHVLTCFLVRERTFNLAPPVHPPAGSRTRKSALVEKDVAVVDLKKWRKTRQVASGTVLEKKVMADMVVEKKGSSLSGLYTQLQSQIGLLGELLKKKEISHTLLWFCASYALVPVMGSSIFFFQTEVLRIDPMFIGFSRMVGQVGLMVGSQLYGGSLKNLPLRKLLGSVQVLLSCCMLADLLLVKRVNIQLGIPDQFYVLGASALVDTIAQFKVLPVIVRLGNLCPPGSEGSLMAFFSSCHCLAGLCSGYLGVALASKLRISAQSFEGLPIGIFIQAMCALLPVLFIKLIPGEATPKPEKVAEKIA